VISLTLKLILHITENDSEYRDVAPLSYNILIITAYIIVINASSIQIHTEHANQLGIHVNINSTCSCSVSSNNIVIYKHEFQDASIL